MRLPKALVRAIARVAKRRCNILIPWVIRDAYDGHRLVNRFNIFSSRWLNIRIHEFVGSDDRELHDHPWWNISVVLEGEYWEVVPDGWDMRWDVAKTKVMLRAPGGIVWRRATAQHRLILKQDIHWRPRTCWTLFIHGRRTRNWGFWSSAGTFSLAEDREAQAEDADYRASLVK